MHYFKFLLKSIKKWQRDKLQITICAEGVTVKLPFYDIWPQVASLHLAGFANETTCNGF